MSSNHLSPRDPAPNESIFGAMPHREHQPTSSYPSHPRMRSLSMSLPWKRPKTPRITLDGLPQQVGDLAIDDETSEIRGAMARPRGLSQGHSPVHNHGFKGMIRRASTSLRGIVHRRPSIAAAEGAIWEEKEQAAGPPRPTTSHLIGPRSKHQHGVRPVRSFYGLNTTHDSFANDERPAYTSYHTRPGMGAEPPVIPYHSGAAAKASAAMHNEYLARSGGLYHSPDWLMPYTSDGNKDDESGVGIAATIPEAKEAYIERVNPVARLPTELAIHIFALLDASTLSKACLVASEWNDLIKNQHIWRDSCMRETTGTYAMGRPIAVNAGLGLPKNTPDKDWRMIYKVRMDLERHWREGKARPTYLTGHTDSIYCHQFDEHKIITGSRDRTIRVWDVHTHECRFIIGAGEFVRQQGVLLDQDGEPTHCATDSDGKVASVSMPQRLSYDMHHKASILCLQYDDRMLATGSSDSTCILYDIKDGFRPFRRLQHHTAAVLDLAFDDKHIVTCSKDITICVWDRETGTLLRQLHGHTGPVNAVQMRGNTIVSCSGDFKVKLWNIDTGKNIREFVGHTKGLACSQFSEDGRYIASAGNDQKIRIWDANTGECLRVMRAHHTLVRSLHIDSVSGRLVSGSYDTDIKVWDMNSGRQLLDFPHWHSSWVLSAKSDYRRIVSTGPDPKVLLMDFGAGIDGIDLLNSEGSESHGGQGGFI
ncbi:uncharacterized protein J7T54_000537 [Emericellopsis cladophorae]|uniref:F-box domain-containing protein n=1 Tax=Emericellopsis cladophorae TaxID=2686198 RepID=A0A9Q0BBP5_9HYPO|nr:uncharacterized protein J7T54_000537 [Emericellopsis cladophorae]KAI6778881.1 hypothetical protein J7T54_000537 [Emericellopsis cladophorae]